MDYRYVAKDAYAGAYLPGVPARDLDADELPEIAARRGQTVKELSADLEQCGLYQGHGEGSKASKSSAKPAHKKAVALGKKTQTTSQAVAAGLAKLSDADDPEPKPSAPSVLPIQTGPTGAMIEPAPIEPKAP